MKRNPDPSEDEYEWLAGNWLAPLWYALALLLLLAVVVKVWLVIGG